MVCQRKVLPTWLAWVPGWCGAPPRQYSLTSSGSGALATRKTSRSSRTKLQSAAQPPTSTGAAGRRRSGSFPTRPLAGCRRRGSPAGLPIPGHMQVACWRGGFGGCEVVHSRVRGCVGAVTVTSTCQSDGWGGDGVDIQVCSLLRVLRVLRCASCPPVWSRRAAWN